MRLRSALSYSSVSGSPGLLWMSARRPLAFVRRRPPKPMSAPEPFGVRAAKPLETDLVHGAERLALRHLPAAQRRILLGRHAVAHERPGEGARGLFSDTDGVGGTLEARRGNIAELRRNEHVARAEGVQLALDVDLAEKIDQLTRNAE